MIHLLFILLKIIGILLLILVGLLLFLILSVLFVPTRYRFSGEYHKELKGFVKVTWLLHIISIWAEYQDGKPMYSIKIFGIQIFPQKRKKEQAGRKEKPVSEIGYLEEDSEDQPLLENSEKKSASDFKEEKEEQEEIIENKKEQIEIVEDVLKKSDLEQKQQKDLSVKMEEHNPQNRNKTENFDHNPKVENNTGDAMLPIFIEEKKKKQENKKRVSFFTKIKNVLLKIKSFIQKVVGVFKGIPVKIQKISTNYEETKLKIQGYLDFYREEETQHAVCIVKRQIKKILRHILPRKFQGMIVFGLEDPALTGQILGMLSLGIPFYQEHLKIYPVFQEKVLEFEVSGRGYLRPISIVWPAIYILLDKKVRNVIKKGRKMF